MKKETRITIVFIVFQVFLVVLAFMLGIFVQKNNGYAQFNLPILNQSLEILRANGLPTPPPDPALEYGMIRGMLQAYGDPFASFSEPAQAELQSDQLAGKFGGVGANIIQNADGFFYLLPYPDSSAENAGVVENDRLIAVDDVIVDSNFTSDQVAALIRGPENSRVKLTLTHPPEYTETTILTIKRVEVPLPSLQYFLAQNQPQIGIIQLNIIAETSPDEISAAIEDLLEREAKAFVIDLRNNGGGLLDSGIELAELFLSRGNLVIERRSKNQPSEVITATKNGRYADLPIVIITNGNTASAAEIFAGALQANGRCKLVGFPTYGKNTIQLVFSLQDGSSLHITSSEWGFPALPDFSAGNGLIPEFTFQDMDSMDPQIMENAVNYLLTEQETP